MATRTNRRAGTKYHVCPSCGKGSKGQSIWGYRGKGAERFLVMHRIRAHGYAPRADEQPSLRRYV